MIHEARSIIEYQTIFSQTLSCCHLLLSIPAPRTPIPWNHHGPNVLVNDWHVKNVRIILRGKIIQILT